VADQSAAGGVSRRLVTKTAIWTTPVVLTAISAPAYAAASTQACQDFGQDALNQGIGTTVTWFYMGGDVTSVDADVTITATSATGASLTPGSGNRTLQRTKYFLYYVKLAMPKVTHQGDTVTLTLDFSRIVYNFSCTITNIDRTSGQWADQVSASPTPFSVLSRGSAVVGSGTPGDPFASNVDQTVSDASGDVTLRWPGPMTQATITYTAADAQNTKSGQFIGVGGFSYDNCV
jgi:hypothetical protein